MSIEADVLVRVSCAVAAVVALLCVAPWKHRRPVVAANKDTVVQTVSHPVAGPYCSIVLNEAGTRFGILLLRGSARGFTVWMDKKAARLIADAIQEAA
jgi:hypothetical protein